MYKHKAGHRFLCSECGSSEMALTTCMAMLGMWKLVAPDNVRSITLFDNDGAPRTIILRNVESLARQGKTLSIHMLSGREYEFNFQTADDCAIQLQTLLT